jgi:hypothetical protein
MPKFGCCNQISSLIEFDYKKKPGDTGFGWKELGCEIVFSCACVDCGGEEA